MAAGVTAEKDWVSWIRERTEPHRAHEGPEALEDLLVLDASRGTMAGPFCSSILGEWGAEVIRVEPPGGDVVRRFSPFGLEHLGTGLAYLVEGRNKFHVTCNLGKREGRDLFKRLAAKADILIETARPGEMDRSGIGYRQLAAVNPRLIYVAITSYGQFGPKARANARKPNYEAADQALSGLVQCTGEMASGPKPKPEEVPTKAGNWMGWYVAGAWAAFGAMSALRYRDRTGRGQMVDITGTEGIMRFMEDMVLWYQKAGAIRQRVGVMDTAVSPYNFFRCKDGYQMIAGFSDPNFFALTTIMGRPELRGDPRFNSFLQRGRPANRKALHDEIERWTVHHTSQEILERVQDYMLNKRGPGTVATGRVNSTTEVLQEDNWWQRGALQRIDDPIYGDLVLQGQPYKATETPPRMKWACRPVGRDNESVYLRHLGLGPGRVKTLARQGII